MQPSRQWRRGELKRGPEGDAPERKYEDTYWVSEAREGEDAQLLDVMHSDLDHLESRSPFLREFCAAGGGIQYYISWFASDRSGGTILSPSILKRFSDLNIYLAFDVYSSQSRVANERRESQPRTTGPCTTD